MRSHGKPQLGHTLVELLLTLGLASLLLLAAVASLATTARRSRDAQTTLELAEAVGFSLDLLERAIRSAGSYGLATSQAPLAGSIAVGTAEPPELAVGGHCTPGLALDLTHPVQWRDWTQGPWPAGCAASPGGRGMPGSAVLVARRAVQALSPGDRGVLWLESSPIGAVVHRSAATHPPDLPATGVLPTPAVPARTRLEVEVYYVSRDSTGQRDWPSLRRKRLVGGTTGPRFEDEELVPGIVELTVIPRLMTPDGSARLLEVAVRAVSSRTRNRQREARRYVWIRNGAATPWP